MDIDPNFKAVEMLAKHGDSAHVQVQQIIAMVPAGSPEWKLWGKVEKLVRESSNDLKRRHRSRSSNG